MAIAIFQKTAAGVYNKKLSALYTLKTSKTKLSFFWYQNCYFYLITLSYTLIWKNRHQNLKFSNYIFSTVIGAWGKGGKFTYFSKFAKIVKIVFRSFRAFPARIFAKIVFFVAKTDYRKKISNCFAMSSAVSPWGTGFISLLLAKSDSSGIFCCIPRKSCFDHTFFST
jgi:hypothetical protein